MSPPYVPAPHIFPVRQANHSKLGPDRPGQACPSLVVWLNAAKRYCVCLVTMSPMVGAGIGRCSAQRGRASAACSPQHPRPSCSVGLVGSRRLAQRGRVSVALSLSTRALHSHPNATGRNLLWSVADVWLSAAESPCHSFLHEGVAVTDQPSRREQRDRPQQHRHLRCSVRCIPQ